MTAIKTCEPAGGILGLRRTGDQRPHQSGKPRSSQPARSKVFRRGARRGRSNSTGLAVALRALVHALERKIGAIGRSTFGNFCHFGKR